MALRFNGIESRVRRALLTCIVGAAATLGFVGSANAYPIDTPTIGTHVGIVVAGAGIDLEFSGFLPNSNISLYFTFARASISPSPARYALLASHSQSAHARQGASVATGNPAGVPANATYIGTIRANSQGVAHVRLCFADPGRYTIYASGLNAAGKHTVVDTSFVVKARDNNDTSAIAANCIRAYPDSAAGQADAGSGTSSGVSELARTLGSGQVGALGEVTAASNPTTSGSSGDSLGAKAKHHSVRDYVPWAVLAGCVLLAGGLAYRLYAVRVPRVDGAAVLDEQSSPVLTS